MKSKILSLSFVAMVTTFCTIAYAQQQGVINSKIPIFHPESSGVKTTFESAKIGLAKHLRRQKAKMYGAYWCPYCTRQKQLFGSQAFNLIRYIECDPRGQNAKPDLCRQANVRGYPTWEINGQQYRGMRSLSDLANISGYRGSRNF
jgi:glutaredoxin